MQIEKRYAYSVGLGVGLVMGLSSMFATFLMDDWLDRGGLAMVVSVDILIGISIGALLTYLANKLM